MKTKTIAMGLTAIIVIGLIAGSVVLYMSMRTTEQANVDKIDTTPIITEDPTKPTDTDTNVMQPPSMDYSVDEIEIDETPVEDEPIEVDWEEPPVLTYYEEEADTNSDGHVENSEWENWVEKHPEDLNQDMIIEDEEKEAYESNDQEAMDEFQPTDADDIAPPTEEELEKINDEGRKLAEEGNSGGLAGLINADNGGDPDAFKDTGSKGNVDMGIQVAG